MADRFDELFGQSPDDRWDSLFGPSKPVDGFAKGQESGRSPLADTLDPTTWSEEQQQRTALIKRNEERQRRADEERDATKKAERDREAQAEYTERAKSFAGGKWAAAENAAQTERERTPGKYQDFGSAFLAGIDDLQKLTYSAAEAVGEATGNETLEGIGERGRVRNTEEAAEKGERGRFQDIETLADAVAWVGQTSGNLIPVMVPAMAGGVAGGVAAGAAGVSATVGAVAGAFVPSLSMGIGEVQASAKEKDPDQDANAWTFVGGSAIAALDSILPGKVGSKLISAFGREAAEEAAVRALSRPMNALSEGAKGMATEALTESLQEAIGEVTASLATKQDINWDALPDQMIEAAAAGGLMGGGIGAATGAATAKPIPSTENPNGLREPPADWTGSMGDAVQAFGLAPWEAAERYGTPREKELNPRPERQQRAMERGEVELTPDDAASPYAEMGLGDLITQGKGESALSAEDALLQTYGVPKSGSEVVVRRGPDAIPETGRVIAPFTVADDRGEKHGVHVLMNDGSVYEELFDDIQAGGQSITAVEEYLAPAAVEAAPQSGAGVLPDGAPMFRPGKPVQEPTASSPGNRDAVIRFVMNDLEGGAQRVVDSGGVTRYGISKNANPDVDVENLTEAQAVEIYRKRYWEPLGLDKMDPAFAAVAFDAAVNHGQGAARQMIAQAGGDVGTLLALRRDAYADLVAKNPDKYGQYARGWENRLTKVEAAIGGAGIAEASPVADVPFDADGDTPELTFPEVAAAEFKPVGVEAAGDRYSEKANKALADIKASTDRSSYVEGVRALGEALNDGDIVEDADTGVAWTIRKRETKAGTRTIEFEIEGSKGAANFGFQERSGEQKSYGDIVLPPNPRLRIRSTEAATAATPTILKDGFKTEKSAALYVKSKKLDAATVQPSDNGFRVVAAPQAPPATATPSAVVDTPAVEIGAVAASGEATGGEWQSFAPETGTLNVPRADMPQIKAEHRGAMVNFLNARGIAHDEATISADLLKPTQAEFSTVKVQKAIDFEGGNRAILVSNDGYVVDGHHQWLAAQQKGEDVRAIRLQAPIADVLAAAHEFPSSTVDEGAAAPAKPLKFDPLTHVPAMRELVAKRSVPLGNAKAIAKKLNLTVTQAQRVMATVAGAPDSGVYMSRKGQLRRVAKRQKPLHAMEFIRSIGGVRNDGGHDLRNLAGVARFPGVINKRGRSLEEVAEQLYEAGYLRTSDPDNLQNTPTEREVLEFLADASVSRRYAVDDLNDVAERDGAEGNERFEAQARDQIADFADDEGVTLSEEEIVDALDFVASGETVEYAVQAAVHNGAARALEQIAEASANDAYVDAAGGLYEGDTAEQRDRGAEESDARSESAEGSAAGSRPPYAQPESAGPDSFELTATEAPAPKAELKKDPETPDMFGGPTSKDVKASLERKGEGRLKSDKGQKAPGEDGGLFDVQDTTGDAFGEQPLEERLRGILEALERPHGRYGMASIQWQKEIQPRDDILYELGPKPLDASRHREDEYRAYLGDRANVIERAAKDLATGKIDRPAALAQITDADLATVQEGEQAARDEFAYQRTKELAEEGNEAAQRSLAMLEAERAKAEGGPDKALAEPPGPGYTPADGEEGTSDSLRRDSRAVPVRGRARIHALGIAKDLQRNGSAALVGRSATHPKELAELAQVYRDPRYETFRVFFIKDSKIVHATGVSARLPGAAPLLPKEMNGRGQFEGWLADAMRSSGADGYYLLHNHPSGDPTPSRADSVITAQVAGNVPGFLGHVVINSGKYAVINAGGGHKVRDLNVGEDRLLRPSKPHPLLGAPVMRSGQLAELGKQVQEPGYVTLLGVDTKGLLRLIVDYPAADLERPAWILAGALRRAQRMSGSARLFLVGSHDAMLHPSVAAAFDHDLLTDAVDDQGRFLSTWRGIAKKPLPAAFTADAARFVAEERARFGRGATPEFRRWFGDSRAVDESGAPLVVYHGTSRSQGDDAFSMFDTYASNYGLMGMGSYFTADPEVASSYTKKGRGNSPTVYPAFLAIRNPLDMDAPADAAVWQRQFDGIEDFHEGGNTNESWYRAAEELMISEELPMYEGAEAMQDGIRAMGHDGITHLGGGRVDANGKRHRVFVAFDPEQIKSATGNRGTFDPSDPSIVAEERSGYATAPITAATPDFEPSIEERYKKAAKGIGSSGPGLIEKLTEGWRDVAAGFSRHWRPLPNEPRFADLQQQLRKLEASNEVAVDDTVRHLKRLVDGLSRKEYDVFQRKAVLDDLMWETDRSHELPFGFTPETLRDALINIDGIVSTMPNVVQAVRARKLHNRRLAEDMVKAGVLTPEQVRNPAYFRHMILDYARAEVRLAKGGKVKSPYWAKRMGSSLDINANLLEAEFDWIAKARRDIATANVLNWIKSSDHNIREDLRTKAKAENKALVDEIIAGDEAAAKIDGKFRSNIGRGLQLVKDELEAGTLIPPPHLQAAADALTGGSRDSSVFPLLSWVMDENKPGAMGAAMVLSATGRRKAWEKALLKEKWVDPEDMDGLIKQYQPEGYATWQPRPGRHMFTAQTVSEHVIDMFVSKLAETKYAGIDQAELTAALGAIKPQLVVGGDRYTMILPEELVETLDEYGDRRADGMVAQIFSGIQSTWKQWVLINPRRFVKYNLNNQSGDLDAIIAGNPRALLKVGAAWKELWSVWVQKKAPSALYQEASERGVFTSGLSAQEIPDINRFSGLRHLTEAKSLRPDKIGIRALGNLWNALQGFTNYREALFRMAAYMEYRERLSAGKPVGYGASVPNMVDAVTDPADKAALLARDLIGDYGAISVAGGWLRRFMIPFWSWTEINTKRYYRLTGNAYHAFSKGQYKAGAAAAGQITVGGALTASMLLVRMGVVFAAINLWNHLLFDDEEDDLSEDQRRQLHLILGRNSDGEVITIRLQGALSDVFGMFGFPDAVAGIRKYQQGQGTLGKAVFDMVKAPINRVGTATTPIFTTPIEQALDLELWPDMFQPRKIHDNARHIFQTLNIENEYDLVAGRPSRGYGRSWIESLVYKRDPGETSYSEARSIAYDWMHDVKGEAGGSGRDSPRSNALRDYKIAIRFGDHDAANDALDRYEQFEGTAKGLKQSLKAAHPLGPIPKKHRQEFVSGLTEEQFETFMDAERWYDEVYLRTEPAAE